MVQEFCKERVLSVAQELSQFNGGLTREILREMGELGLVAVEMPESYGGLELDKVSTLISAEGLMASGSASLSTTFLDHTGIGTLPIVWYGTQAQQQKYLPKMATGEWISSFALTEADAGSDVTAAKCTAVLNKEGTHYILNGTKIYVTNGSWADLCITFAKVNGKQYTAFILDKECKGWVVGPEENKMGIKGSSTCTFFLENCLVPVENILGEVGKGTAIALNVLYPGRYKLGAVTMGGSKFAVNLAVNFALERIQFARPIAEFGMIKRKLADMVVRSWTADTMIYMVGGMLDEALALIPSDAPEYRIALPRIIEDHGIEASLAKIVGSESLAANVDDAVQIYGGAGFIEDYPVAGMYRDERINRIFEGTNEINRLLIGGTLLKKALLEELPLRTMILQRRDTWIPIDLDLDALSLPDEARVVEWSRSALMHILNELILAYGQDLKNEQWAIEPLADIVIALANMDVGYKRYLGLLEFPNKQSLTEPVLRCVIAQNFQDILNNLSRLQGLLYSGKDLVSQSKLLNKRIQELEYYPQTIHWQQKIAAQLIQFKQYYLD